MLRWKCNNIQYVRQWSYFTLCVHDILVTPCMRITKTLDIFEVLCSTHFYLPPLRFDCIKDAGIEPGNVATIAMGVKRFIHSARSHLLGEGSTLYQHYTLTFVCLIRFLGPILFIRYKLNNYISRKTNKRTHTENEKDY
jgi:hypothetical protein